MKFRKTTPFATSVVLHLLIGGAFFQWYVLGYPMPEFLSKQGASIPERVKFVRLAGVGSATSTARTAGAGKASKPTPDKQLVAPIEAPRTIAPPAPAKPDAGGDNGVEAGAGTGAGGAMEGMRPMLGDARVYTIPRGLSGAEPKGHKELFDSAFKDHFARYRDSTLALAAVRATERQPGDWTLKDGSGRKWGIDPQFIRLGKFSIPTVLLALLPMNVQGNGPQIYENRRIAAMTEDIKFQAVHAQNAEDFNSAVKRIRERKDRERSDQLKRRREVTPDVLPLPTTFPVATP